MKVFLAISSLSVALVSPPAMAQESILDQLSRYVPDSVLALLDEHELLDAFSITRSRESDAQKAEKITYIATSGEVPRTYSRQQLDLVAAYLTPEEMSRMSGSDIGSAMAIAHSSKPETQKLGMIRALAAR